VIVLAQGPQGSGSLLGGGEALLGLLMERPLLGQPALADGPTEAREGRPRGREQSNEIPSASCTPSRSAILCGWNGARGKWGRGRRGDCDGSACKDIAAHPSHARGVRGVPLAVIAPIVRERANTQQQQQLTRHTEGHRSWAALWGWL